MSTAALREMGWMARPTRAGKRREAGFTLAGLIVIMTVMMIIVAYTVPRQWSTIVQRDKELQTIFIMKQYARAIHEFSRKNGGDALPTNIDQISKAKLPRYIRAKDGEYVDPLTGEVDWLIIPASAVPQVGTPRAAGPAAGTVPATGTNQATATQPAANITAIPMKDYAGGPFVGVRPGKTGKSLLEVNGAQNYEQWTYTVIDYRNEMSARLAAAAKLWQ